ncbi:DUF4446 family protein [Candidatus Woesebacteria bacterium]|jgi:predicted RNA-binding protein with EMAP domain|nr:DUF4446 family protein [Candidatus Woesebacteria bacterium]
MIILYGIIGALVAWTAVLSFITLKMMRHYKSLTTRTKTGSIDDVLDSLLHQGTHADRNIDTLKKAVDELDNARHSYFQKFGFVKFNPFNDRVAGDQSFVIALLDNKQNGFVKTFLYTRDGVRVYVKPIKQGKAVDFELSQEELEAIKKAS